MLDYVEFKCHAEGLNFLEPSAVILLCCLEIVRGEHCHTCVLMRWQQLLIVFMYLVWLTF